MVVAELTVPAIIALVLLLNILYGDSHKQETIFRLLRCISGRPEPPAPPGLQSIPAEAPDDSSAASIRPAVPDLARSAGQDSEARDPKAHS